MHIGKLVFLQTVLDLYRYRRQVELFFKWIRQRLRIKSFFVYTLVAIIKNRLDSNSDLYTILQILSLASLEKNFSSSVGY